MRARGVMRFIILGGVGFGIGWAVAGFFNSGFIAITAPMFTSGAGPPPWWVGSAPYLSWFLAGACGGAGLGLATGSWKRVVALTAAGSLGFGLGSFLFFVLAFLFGFPPVSVAMGAFGGLLLGLVLADWKRVVLLGLAGMVGFGVGGAIATALGMPPLAFDWDRPPLLLVLYVLVQSMVGFIGGASFGAVLGYFENQQAGRSIRSPAQRNLGGIWGRIGILPKILVLLLPGIAIVLVGAPLVVRGFFSVSGVCTEEERKVYAEFPHYGNINKEPQRFPESGGCAVFFDTRASQERVAGYYTEQLKAHGWKVQQREYETTVSGAKKRTFEEVEITGHRGDFSYNVLFESHQYYDPPRPGVHVAVHVFKSSKKAPASCGSEEKAALAEFSHYGGKEVGEDLEASPLPGKARGACVTGYPARGASQEQVSTYYEEKLTEYGWEVEQSSEETEGSRDGLRYVVHYWRNPGSTEVEVQVFKG
jgi:hypothetical protein